MSFEKFKNDIPVPENHSEDIFNFQRPKWQSEANCRGVGIPFFFPKNGKSIKGSKALCESCKVQKECLDFGINEKFGIWGSKNEKERRKIRRDLNENKDETAD